MPRPQPVQFSDAIEPLVQFIEETPPGEIVDRTLDKLRAGVPTKAMLTLAVTRSTDLPPGITAVRCIRWPASMRSRLVEQLQTKSFPSVLQHVALSNKHIHHPGMGP